MAIVRHEDDRLSDHELRELEALEERFARGTAVKWGEPQTIKGHLIRPMRRSPCQVRRADEDE